MELFRAVPSAGFSDGLLIPHPATRRVPSNVPYVVDNLWEWLRPQGLPSRRHAAYASPTPALALLGASVPPQRAHEYVVARVEFEGRVAMAQLAVADARFHPDVKTLPCTLLALLGAQCWVDAPLEIKRVASPLFAPGIAREEVESILNSLPDAAHVKQRLRCASDFWTQARVPTSTGTGAVLHPEGELFFEAFDGYRLHCAQPRRRP